MKTKKNNPQKISISNILGAVGAISGLATGAFMLQAELKSYDVFPYQPEYHSYDAWKLAAFIMFLVSFTSWAIYVIYKVISHYRKHK